MPSTAQDVATTGRPRARLWLILPLMPAPTRNGATLARQRSSRGSRSGTWPRKRTPGWLASARTDGVASAPTSCSAMPGNCWRTSGRISVTIQRAASTLGGWRKLPTKTRPLRASNPGGKSPARWIFDTMRTSAPGTSSRSRSRSTELTTQVVSAARTSSSSIFRVRAAVRRALASPARAASRSSRRKCRSTVSNTILALGASARSIGRIGDST